jgi:predicted O-methyltransferase YrrM
MASERTLKDILDTSFDYRGYGLYSSIAPWQEREELEEVAQRVKEIEPERIMEIGTYNGGTWYLWARYFDDPEFMLSLDLPEGAFGGGYRAEYQRLLDFMNPDAEMEFVRKDSHEETTLEEVESLVGEEKLDFLYIDGDHSYEGVKADFEMYAPLVRSGGVVALHDIVERPHESDVEVDEFWEELKEEYETEEIVASPDQDWAGNGIVYID